MKKPPIPTYIGAKPKSSFLPIFAIVAILAIGYYFYSKKSKDE